MPIDEHEVHPYLEIGAAIPNATKLILGSFPVYNCTDPDTAIKLQGRNLVGSVRFFYGSAHSSFWDLYSSWLDDTITLPRQPNMIVDSLIRKHIAISDTIMSCRRVGLSSLDQDLRRKTWNRDGIIDLVNNGITKIICTSKDVLLSLETKILCQRYRAVAGVNDQDSLNFQNEFLNGIHINYNNQDLNQIGRPIARVFTLNANEALVKAIAIPSPGSPFRQLRRYGYTHGNMTDYLNAYLTYAFNWFSN